MASKKQVVCLGVIVADVIGGPLTSVPNRAGMVVVDEMRLYSGGGASNTAVALSRMGARVSVLGRVGADNLGDFLIDKLAREKVSTDLISRDPELGTSATMVMVDPDGERRFIHYIGANGGLTGKQIGDDLLSKFAILHIAYAFVLPGLDGLPMAELLRKAREAGVVTLLDTAWDNQARWMELLGPCLPAADYFVPNLAEAQALTGLSDPYEVAQELIELGANNVILKMNKEGSFFMDRSGAHFLCPAYEVKAVDSTGAGDAFDAGVITGIWHGWPIEGTIKFANAVGALCAAGYGAAGKVESLQKTLDFMASQPLNVAGPANMRPQF